ncbi:MAG: multidrug effflux MFS transporter [Gammaproteobacteria bacterium]|nr:multidrug effflux MFS transporter [Gammaproteobacteria bacterium]
MPLLWVLILISALGPISMNGVLPANTAVMQELAVDYSSAQLVLTVFLLAMLLFQLPAGAWSDRFGRRPVMLLGLAGYALGGVLCVISQSLELLLIGRFIQGAGGAVCMSLPRTIVRDVYDRDRAASMIGYMTTAMMLAPMFGPALGGWLTDTFSWRWMYVAIVMVSLIVLGLCWKFLPETNPEQATGATKIGFWSASNELMHSGYFVGVLLTLCGSVGVYYTFLAGAPYVVIELYGHPAAEYGLWFALTGIGYMSGNLIAGRYAERLGTLQLAKVGMIPLVISMALFWMLSGWQHAAALLIPAGLFALSNGVVIPNLTAMALSVNTRVAGTASGLTGMAQLAVGVGFSALLGGMLQDTATPLYSLMTVSFLIALLGLPGWIATERVVPSRSKA